jgi:hypothetical protein
VTALGLLSRARACKKLVGLDKCLSWEEMSFKLGIGLVELCED